MSQVTTHVLDTALGAPAADVPVVLERPADGSMHGSAAGAWTVLASASTDRDGRVGRLGDDALDPGTYRIRFDTQSYYVANGQTAFFPEVSVTFVVSGSEHYHVPLLLSPFGYSTYRGS